MSEPMTEAEPRQANARFVVAAVYLLCVPACIFLALNLAGQMGGAAFLALFLLTLPWSFIFAGLLMHGPGLQGLAVVYMACGAVNTYLICRLWPRARASSGGA